jgi:hypothetical protein
MNFFHIRGMAHQIEIRHAGGDLLPARKPAGQQRPFPASGVAHPIFSTGTSGSILMATAC